MTKEKHMKKLEAEVYSINPLLGSVEIFLLEKIAYLFEKIEQLEKEVQKQGE